MSDSRVKIWHKPQSLTGGALVLTAVLGIVIHSQRVRVPRAVLPSSQVPEAQQSSGIQPPSDTLRAHEPQQVRDAQPGQNAKPSAEVPEFVLVGIESKPSGVTIVRAENGFVYGHTPETVELRRSATPVRIRFEMEGYIPLTREVSAASDSVLSITLKPRAKSSARTTWSSDGKT